MATAGDVNEDGYSDIIVSMPTYDNGQEDEGMVIVYRGTATGIDGSAIWYKESNQADSLYGSSVSSAGVLFLDDQGEMQSHSLGSQPGWLPESSLSELHAVVYTLEATSFIARSLYAENGDWYILVGVPLFDTDGIFSGSAIRVSSLRSNPISAFVQNLSIGVDGFSYLGDGRGRALAHRDASLAGTDLSSAGTVKRAISGENGAKINDQASGTRNIDTFAPFRGTDWSLVLQESWDSVFQPIQAFELLITGIGVLLILLVIILTWRGIESIAKPIHTLHDQVRHVTRGEVVELAADSGIAEIDALEHSFIEMNRQISSYRDGLPRYLGVVTGSLEEERRWIGRELHDETKQDLLAIGRRLELFISSDSDSDRSEKLATLQKMVEDTLAGLRQFNRDLRPLLLNGGALLTESRSP